MKNFNGVFFIALLMNILAITACTEEKEGILPPEKEIKLEDLIGTYKVQAVWINGTSILDGLELGDIWEIAQDSIRIACAPKVEFTYANNAFKVNEVDYKMSVTGNSYSITFTADNQTIVLLFAATSDVCPIPNPTDPDPTDPDPTDPDLTDPDPAPYVPPVVGNVELDKMYGYATAGTSTTGGENATATNIHHFNNGVAFRTWLAAREKAKSTVPAIVWLSGTFNKEDGRASSSPWFDVKRTGNISFIGVDGFTMKNVGFFLKEATNIIIRNIYIEMPKADNGADGISMQDSKNVWVDHCTFKSVNQTHDYEDGSCDITHGSYNVTLSWSHFINTQKTCLIGHSDSQSADVQITATLHHNFFDLSSSRHPRVRYGKVHVYNNYFNKVSTYGVGSAYGAMVLVENNYFEGVHLPTDICTYPAKKSGSSYVSNLTGKVAGYLYESDNTYVSKPSNASDPYPFTNVEYKAYNGEKLSTALTYNDFKPAYSYIVDASETIKDVVPSGAGVGKLGYRTASVSVDNGGITTPGQGGGEDPDPDVDVPGIDDPDTNLGDGWLVKYMGPSSGGSYASNGSDMITMNGKGKFESGKQSFTFVYQEISGDFVITAKLNSFTNATSSNQAEAGLLLTPDISKEDGQFIYGFGGKGGNGVYNYSCRLSAGVDRGSGTLTAPTGSGDVYLKLEKEGAIYKVSYSLDGGTTYGSSTDRNFTTLPDKLYVGLAVSGANNEATAVFSNVKINGELQSF
ncbi:Pectate trisaccharide-lyase [termite gut metagenome]|uniref:pectate lyase n=1 Tax=termite gut metagenome TaxID=433724 RepID=A0A5J4SFY4_9ZZZZ